MARAWRVIEGKKIKLRDLNRYDLHKCLKWLKDRRVIKYLDFDLVNADLAQEIRWLRIMHSSPNDYVFAIQEKDGKYIGNIGLHRINWRDKNCMLGIFIGEIEEWNKGNGTDAIKTILKYAVNKLGLHKINLHVYEYNPRAIRVYEKCGFKKEGLLKEGHYYNGKYWDVIIMGILNRDVVKIISGKDNLKNI